MVEAAAMPETLFTVWTNVFERGSRPTASRCWCTAEPAASARRRSRSATVRPHVIVTCGSDEKCAPRAGARRRARDQLPDAGFRRGGQRLTERRGVDVVLDMVGGDYLPRNLDCLAEEAAT